MIKQPKAKAKISECHDIHDILDRGESGIQFLHFSYSPHRHRPSTTVFVNNVKIDSSKWCSSSFSSFLDFISIQKSLEKVTFNPVASSLILKIISRLPPGLAELSFGCCAMNNEIMMAIAQYLDRNLDKSRLVTFQIWDASEVIMEGLNLLLQTLAPFLNLKVLQLITDSGFSPLDAAMISTLPNLVRSLPNLEDLILNSQEEGSPECACKVIYALSVHNKVRALDLSTNVKADCMLKELGTFISNNQNLERLYLWGNYFVGDGFKHLVSPMARHRRLDRLHIEIVPSRFSLENCRYLAEIIEKNKSLSELDCVDYNEEERSDTEQATILLKALDKNLTLSRIDFIAQPDHYFVLDSVSTFFTLCNNSDLCHFVGRRSLAFESGLLDDFCADLLVISRLVPLLDHIIPREIADLTVQASIPKLLALEAPLLLSVLRSRVMIKSPSCTSFSFQSLIRACYYLRSCCI